MKKLDKEMLVLIFQNIRGECVPGSVTDFLAVKGLKVLGVKAKVGKYPKPTKKNVKGLRDLGQCDVCKRTEPHIHCPECGSTEHVAEDCDMEG